MLYCSSPTGCVLKFQIALVGKRQLIRWIDDKWYIELAACIPQIKPPTQRVSWTMSNRSITIPYPFGHSCGWWDYKRKDKINKRASRRRDKFLSSCIHYALHLLGSISISAWCERILEAHNLLEDNGREILLSSRFASVGFPFISLSLHPWRSFAVQSRPPSHESPLYLSEADILSIKIICFIEIVSWP